MPGGFKDNPANDTSHQTSTSATTHLDNPTPIATTMRSANVVNPHGSAYEVAGPFTGGTSSVHNRALDAVKGQSLDGPVGGSGGTPAHSLTETVKDNAAAAVISAAAAGAYDVDNQHDTNLHPISNTTNSNTPASPTVSSPMTPSSITTASSGSPSLKPLGPHDRPPVKVAIRCHKPSDKATYGNLDSPGAQNHPGPLSDRALAGTPPPTSTPKKTIADPFGPVMVANWNDHKRQTDVSTPTSEDFESPHLHGAVGRSSTAPGSAPLSAPAAAAGAAAVGAATAGTAKRMHAPSPLRDEVPPVIKANAAHAQPPTPTGYFPHVQHSSSMDATTTPHHGSTVTDAIPHQQHKEPLTERIKEAFSHHEHDTTKPTAAGTTAAAATAAAVPLPKQTFGERVKEVFHHESHPTVEVPIKVNTAMIATSSAAPEVFVNKTEYVPVENLKDIDLSKVAQSASHMAVKSTLTETTTTTTTSTKPAVVKMEPLGERIKEVFHHESHATTTTTTTAIPKEPLGERIKEVFYHEPRPTVEVPIKVYTATIATSSAAPEIFTNKTELVPIENLKDVDISKIALAASHMPGKTTTTEKATTTTTTTTTKDEPIKASTATTAAPAVAPIVEKESLVDRVKDVFRRDPSDTTTSTAHSKAAVPTAVAAATAGTAAGVAAFLNDKEADNTTTPPHTHDHRAYLAPGTKSSITPTAAPETLVFQLVDASPLKKHTQAPAPVFDTTYMNIPANAHAPVTTSSSTTTAPVAHHPVRPVEHTEYTIGPPVTATKAAVAAAAVAPIIPFVATTSSTTKPSTSEIHFTDPKTLVPITEHRTWAIPGETDHRSMATKLKDAVTLHTASEYGPADPKDLHLSDPKTLGLVDRVPAAAVPVAAAAAVAAPLVANSTIASKMTTPAKDATVVAPVVATLATKPSTNEIQFTDPKTLRPLTGTRTMDVPPPADHSSMTTKVKDAIGTHKASEYGPADPKDLHLSDPKTLRLIDHVPVVPAMTAATAAAVAAPAVVVAHKMATDATKPVVVKEEKTNPIMTAPHPVIPKTSSSSGSKTQINPVLTAPHPTIPHHDGPNPVLTAPRPVIPASAIETHSTTTHHSVPEKVVAPLIAAAAVVPMVTHAPIVKPTAPVTAAHVPAPVPIVEKSVTTTTTTSYDDRPATVVQAPITQRRPSAHDINFANKIAAVIPEAYQGPIPQLKPGEEIVWVKTVTTTDYYDDNSPPGLGPGAPVNTVFNINHGSNNMSAPVGAGGYGAPGMQGQGQGQGVPVNTMHDNTTGQKRHSDFFDRLTHRHHDNVDKGKQRT